MHGIAFSSSLEHNDIKSVLAAHCNVSESQVSVFDTDDQMMAAPTENRVNVVCSTPSGQFPFWLDVYADSLVESDRDLAVAFAAACGVEALVRDPTPNPYRWVHIVPPDGAATTVVLDGTQLDDHDSFVIMPDDPPESSPGTGNPQ